MPDTKVTPISSAEQPGTNPLVNDGLSDEPVVTHVTQEVVGAAGDVGARGGADVASPTWSRGDSRSVFPRAILSRRPTKHRIGRTGSIAISDDSESGGDRSNHVRAMLDYAHAQGRKHRVRVQLPLLVIGGVLLFASIIAAVVLLVIRRPALEWAAVLLGLCAGSFTQLLALSPSDAACIRIATRLSVLASILWATTCAVRAHTLFTSCPGCGCGLAHLAQPRCFHVLTGVSYVHWGLSGLYILCSVAPILFSGKGITTHGRQHLERLWVSKGVCLASIVSSNSWWIATYVRVLCRGSVHEDAALVALWLVVTIGIALLAALCFMPHVRMRLLTRLASRSEAVTAAASIASLLGDRTPEEVHALAHASLRCVTFDKVRAEHLVDGVARPDLYALSVPAGLGYVDVFISHSWSDDPAAKWKALSEWCARFSAEHKREARCWIDKYCIDQNAIEANLTCLPVFIAACDRLLVLAGETYLKRLWCLIEVRPHRALPPCAPRMRPRPPLRARLARAA